MLNALKILRRDCISSVAQSWWSHGTNTTSDICADDWLAGGESGGWRTNQYWIMRSPAPVDEALFMYRMGNPPDSGFRYLRTRTKYYAEYFNTNILHEADVRMRVRHEWSGDHHTFWDNNAGWQEYEWVLVKSYTNSLSRYEETNWTSYVMPYNDTTVGIAPPAVQSSSRGWTSEKYIFITWSFFYCTNKYW